MTKGPKYYLVLDSNVWVSERMLYSTLGSASLYALTTSAAIIGLPEVVQKEVNRILLEQADKGAESIRRSSNLLQQLSGLSMSIVAPSQDAIQKGIDRRWTELSGLLVTIDFTFEHARSALERIIAKTPPCGPNNEQFRDCCIWQCAVDLAKKAPVHLVSGDTAFYEGGSRSGGLSRVLNAELEKLGIQIHLHADLSKFLDAVEIPISSINEASVRSSIVEAVRPLAIEIATDKSKGGSFELGQVRDIKITGHSTPKASVVAISFSIAFDLARIEIEKGTERQQLATMTLQGSCSHEPVANKIGDVEIGGWSKSIKAGHGGLTSMSHDSRISELYGKGSIRIL